MTTYAVTGVTGHFGQAALTQLATKVDPGDIIALARNVDKATKLVPAGVAVRQADYDDPTSLRAAFTGVDRLLFISSQPGGPVSRQQQHANVIAAAKAAGVGYIAYTSFPNAAKSTAPLAADHQATELELKLSGIPYSFLRNNWYLENELASLHQAVKTGELVHAAGAGRVSWALEAEYAQAAANVLTLADPKPIYEFGGPLHTYAELAAAMPGSSKAKGVDASAYSAGLVAAGMSAEGAAIVTSIQTFIREGQLAIDSDDLTTVLGRDLTPLPAALAKLLG